MSVDARTRTHVHKHMHTRRAHTNTNMHTYAKMQGNINLYMHSNIAKYIEDLQELKHTRIHLLTDIYRYLHLHNCASAPKNACARTYTHYTCSLSQMHN